MVDNSIQVYLILINVWNVKKQNKAILLNMYKYLNIEKLHQQSKQSIFNGCIGKEKGVICVREDLERFFKQTLPTVQPRILII